jgi:hypothetical protein
MHEQFQAIVTSSTIVSYALSTVAGTTAADRHAVIAERIARVHAGEATTLSMEEVERTIREELDF